MVYGLLVLLLFAYYNLEPKGPPSPKAYLHSGLIQNFVTQISQNLEMLRLASKTLRRTTPKTLIQTLDFSGSSASNPSLSIWRRKKEMGKEGLTVVKELKRLKSNENRFDRFMQTHVSRLLRTDLLAVLAEFQRQDQIYDVVRKEIWYRPDMYFYRDMLMMLARNKMADEAKCVWEHLKKEEVLFDQHTHGDIVRSFLDGGLPSLAMELYDEMRQSPDPPMSLSYRVILKGLLPYPELREKVKDDFLELFPGMIIFDPPEDLFEDSELTSEDD